MNVALSKITLLALLATALLFQSCQTSKHEAKNLDPAAPTKEINYHQVFEAALKLSGNRLSYKMQERTAKDGSTIYTAEFATKKKTSFQTLEMMLVKSLDCLADTPSQNMKLKNKGVGPSGASFDVSFCTGTQLIKLTDLNRLSMSDHPHGVGLIALAKNIQAEAKK